MTAIDKYFQESADWNSRFRRCYLAEPTQFAYPLSTRKAGTKTNPHRIAKTARSTCPDGLNSGVRYLTSFPVAFERNALELHREGTLIEPLQWATPRVSSIPLRVARNAF